MGLYLLHAFFQNVKEKGEMLKVVSPVFQT